MAQARLVSTLRECKEYAPKPTPCKITINLHRADCDSAADANATSWSRAHYDVTIAPGRPAWVLLANKSPLLACSLVSTPTALQRDSSASFAALITSLAGLGLPGVNPNLAFMERAVPHAAEPEWRLTGEELERILETASLPAANPTDQQKALAETAKDLASDVQSLIISVTQFQQHLADARTAEKNLTDNYIAARDSVLQDWRYDYPDKDVAKILENPKELWQPLTNALGYPLPDAAQLQKDLTAVKGDVLALAHKFQVAQNRFGDLAKPWNDRFKVWRDQLNELTARADRDIQSLLADLSYFQAAQKLLQQSYTALVSIMGQSGNYLSTYPGAQALAVGPYAHEGLLHNEVALPFLVVRKMA